jgi:cytidyltransferase-like protein
MKVVFTNGAFDVLTPAHFNLLTKCRELAEENGQVIVAIDTDEKIKKDKGSDRPIFNLPERYQALLELKNSNGKNLIDFIPSFDTNEELYVLIKQTKPDIIVKGSDWNGNVVGSDLAQVILISRDVRFSTTNIIDRVLIRTKGKKDFDPTI